MFQQIIRAVVMLALITVTLSQDWEWNGSAWVQAGSSPMNSQCMDNNNGYVPEGAESASGRILSVCRNGRLVPIGCVADDGRRLREFETMQSADGKHQKTCERSGGSFELKLSACLYNGRTVAPDQSVDSPTQFYTCKKVNDWYLQLVVDGCIHSRTQQRVLIGQEVQEGETSFTCERVSDAVAELHARGCVRNGQRLKVGEQYVEGEFVYYCKIENGRASATCVGCQSPSGQQLYDGDRYQKDEMVFQCDIRVDKNSHRIVGCVQNDPMMSYGSNTIERVVGCHWYEEEGNQAWEMKCEQEGENMAIKEAVGCIYKEGGIERLSVPPGTFTLWYHDLTKSNLGVGCRDNARGQKPTLFTFDPANVRSAASDLTFKTPTGRKRRR